MAFRRFRNINGEFVFVHFFKLFSNKIFTRQDGAPHLVDLQVSPSDISFVWQRTSKANVTLRDPVTPDTNNEDDVWTVTGGNIDLKSV